VIDEQQRQTQREAADTAEASDLEPSRPRADEPDREEQHGEQQQTKSPANHLDLATEGHSWE